MKTASALSGVVLRAFEPHESGFVGGVDELPVLCRGGGLQIDFRGDACRAIVRRGTVAEGLDAPVRKSVFRAILARVAVLCNERRPGSVSPHGGSGEIRLPAGTVLSVRFENTSAVQSLAFAGRESGGVIGTDAGKGDSPARGICMRCWAHPGKGEFWAVTEEGKVGDEPSSLACRSAADSVGPLALQRYAE